MKKYILTITLSLLAFAAAAETAPLTYSRAEIGILRHSAPPMPWREKGGEGETLPLLFDTEVRDAAILYNQKGWFNLSSPSETNGVLLDFGAPTVAPIVPSAQYAPLDILMIDKEGTIRQIVPNLMLSELKEDITPEEPVRAFLFLKGGACERFAIRPGDTVEYKIFEKPPVILSAPPPHQ